MVSWKKLIDIVSVSKTVYDATINIQAAKFTLSDFFCSWIRINMRLARLKENTNLDTDLADRLLENLAKRKNDLLKHTTMLCAIFLDYRVCKELAEREIEIARMTLVNIYEKIRKLKSEEHRVENIRESSLNDFLEEYFAQTNRTPTDEQTKFLILLDTFHVSLQHEVRNTTTSNCLEFWENKKSSYPSLYEVACVINSIPPSQATIERGFSILKFIFGEKRTRIDQELLEKILCIKLNAELTKSINAGQVFTMRQKNV